MIDYLRNEIEVGDIVLICNLSRLQKHVVVSIPSHNKSITVSTCRHRVKRNKWVWNGVKNEYRQTNVWEAWDNPRITEHNTKINKWITPDRIIKLDEKFEGDLSQFKTVKRLEKEFKEKSELSSI